MRQVLCVCTYWASLGAFASIAQYETEQTDACAQILVIALLMRWVLRRHFNIFQWEALFLLVAGISINQLSACSCVLSYPAAAAHLLALSPTNIRELAQASAC